MSTVNGANIQSEEQHTGGCSAGCSGGCTGGSTDGSTGGNTQQGCSCDTHDEQRDGSVAAQTFGEEGPVKTLGRIGSKLVVLSGKGGVGKSTVAVNLAVGLARAGRKVGLLDVDVHGPSVPRLLGLTGTRPMIGEDAMYPVGWRNNLRVMSLGFFLPDPEQAVIWRGPVKMGLIRQFLTEVRWGDLDHLVVDCPPGTGDEPLSVLQLLGTDAQAVIVTTPQGVAVDDVRRSVGFCRELGNPILGIVENMGGYVCPKCGELTPLFPAGGGEALAAEQGVTFLGRIPLHPDLTSAGDAGRSLYEADAAHPIVRALAPIVERAAATLHASDIRHESTTGPQSEAAPGTGKTAATMPTAPTRNESCAPATNHPDTNGDTTMKIAIPVAGDVLCQHFGHCERFALIDVDPATGSVTGRNDVTPPPHEPGLLPVWLSEKGANLVIAGGMGARARALLEERGVKVLIGAPAAAPEAIVAAHMAGTLTLGANTCDH